MIDLKIPATLPNQINGSDLSAAGGETFAKLDPSNGREICQVARSRAVDVEAAIVAARAAQPAWAETTVVKRGEILRKIAQSMHEHRSELAAIVARETGKSLKDAGGETDAAIEM